jgi:molybdenum-dependent DNA-binding transcriptional regulator ModE
MDRMAAMEAFVLVVDTGSFSAASRRLNVGQPAVSKLVAQLEQRFGVKLLVRTTRGLTATEAASTITNGRGDRLKRQTRRNRRRVVRARASPANSASLRQSRSRAFTWCRAYRNSLAGIRTWRLTSCSLAGRHLVSERFSAA